MILFPAIDLNDIDIQVLIPPDYSTGFSMSRPIKDLVDGHSGARIETPGLVPHIFDPFFTTKQLGKGTGLGLSTAFGIVKQSGGAIWTYSEPGRGTTFKVYLPRTDEMPGWVHTKSDKPSGRRHETVLLVEDEPSLLKLTACMLERQGHKVLTAGDGAAALALCRSYPYPIDLLLTDVTMPNMNGAELATAFQALRPRSRILYMSGYTDMAVLDQGALPENFVFLEKPFTAAMLATRIRDSFSSVTQPNGLWVDKTE